MSETQPNVYETCDPTYLKQLRGSVGMDVVQLARIACLSVAQVKSLETGEDDLFYSLAIKRQAYKRTLMILGAPPPVAFTLPQHEETGVPTMVAPVNESLNHIADLTTQPVDGWTSPARAGAWLGRQKFMFAALAAAVTLGGVVVFYPSEGDASMTLASAALPSIAQEPVRPAVASRDEVAPVTATTTGPIAVATEPVKTASAVVAVAGPAASACAFSSDPGPEVSAATPKKEGKFVYLMSPTDTTLCVVDGNKQVSPLQLKAGEGRSVYGAAPWQISGNSLAQVVIYFQGWRASLPEGGTQKIVLVEKALTP